MLNIFEFLCFKIALQQWCILYNVPCRVNFTLHANYSKVPGTCLTLFELEIVLGLFSRVFGLSYMLASLLKCLWPPIYV